MAVDDEIEALLRELFEPMGSVTFRRMFGGLGIFRHGLMFALYSSQGVLAMKADEHSRSRFEAENCIEWQPHMVGCKPISMGYWHAPERLMDEPDEILEWANCAFEAAVRIDQAKPPEKRKLKLQ